MSLGNAKETTKSQQQGDNVGPRGHRAISIHGGTNGLNHRPCSSSGISGTCTFMWECLKRNGTPMGVCRQGFLFGTCCGPSSVRPTPSSSSSSTSITSHGGNNVMIHFPSPQPPAHTYPVFITTKPTTIHTTQTTTERGTTSPTSTTTTPKTTITTPKQKPTTSFTTTSRPTNKPETTVPTTNKPTTLTTQKSTTSPKPITTPKPTTTQKLTTTPKSTTTTRQTTTVPTTTTTESPKAVNILSKQECGLSYFDPLLRDGRIVNGSEATFGEFPWQVSIMKPNILGSFRHNCGGAVIDKQWVVTAAHCVIRFLKSQLRIRIGEHNYATEQEPHPYVERSVKKIIMHPEFNRDTFDKDLALIQLDRPLDLPKYPHVSPICLPGSHHQLMGQNGTISGWGRVKEGGPPSLKLLKATMPIVSNEQCMDMFREAGRNENIPDWFFCAGYPEGGIDACQGDSGGPIVVKDASGRSFLAGVVSWGIGCARPNHPGVFTRISHFMPWILKHVT